MKRSGMQGRKRVLYFAGDDSCLKNAKPFPAKHRNKLIKEHEISKEFWKEMVIIDIEFGGQVSSAKRMALAQNSSTQNFSTFQLRTDKMKDRPKILVIDDMKSSLRDLAAILQNSDFEVATATNGKTGLRKSLSHPFDLILLDLVMPDMDGFSVCEKLKANPKTNEIPVIFISVDANKDNVVKGFEAGAVDYVNKPFNEKELIARITTQIELKRKKEELQKAMNQANKHDQLISAFLANMSHEIRTPINAVLGFAQLLNLENTTEEEKKKFVTIIINSGFQLIDLINDILEVSKIDVGKVHINNKTFALNCFMKEQFESFQLLKKADSKIEYTMKLGAEDDFTIYTDQGKLHQILNNLLSNAVKFTHNGSVELGYTIDKNGMSGCEFYVRDTGIGIPIQHQEIIFDRFMRIENKLEQEYRGTGLGLHISKKLIKLLGGNLWLESTEGKGSCFYFTLPGDGKKEFGQEIFNMKRI
ncbi:MAG: response regulator [Bacteroidales bacterium]|nr:response regulator [Bacteroidales bacterium]MCF8457879.1 response regulator [Bacteroidales bacterium]